MHPHTWTEEDSVWAKEISIAVLWQLLSVQVYFGLAGSVLTSGGALRADDQAVNALGSTFIALAFAMVTWLIIAKVKGNGFDFVDEQDPLLDWQPLRLVLVM